MDRLRGLFGRHQAAHAREPLDTLIEEADGDAVEAAHERTLIANILHIRDLSVSDLMIPRADIVAVEVGTSLPDLLRLLTEKPHSRLPVYRETLDDVTGIVHIKDVLAAMANGRSFDLGSIVRDVMIVAPSLRALDLLLEMRQTRNQMALVVDEFGGIDGLITIEDLIEGIVGEIEDEHDRQAPAQIVARPDGTLVADARLPIEEFEARVGPVLDQDERDEIDTLGGLVFSLAGRVPSRGEVLRHPSGLEFEVLDADPRRIKRLKVCSPSPARADG